MTCGLLDVACHIGGAWEATLSWALSWLSVNFLVGLFLGSVLGAQFGWLAPIAIALAVLARMVPRGGEMLRGRDTPSEVDGPDAAPSPPKPTRKVLFPGLRKRLGL